ncbi:MAG: hypothetical protein KC940_07760 [Candidatus Omnitrophica bacterium]|nr:hypothetical protein [Candidatus Omnitrophota bacterium]MCA9426567.1 hypothetical protein [Candidatus Omnitrophota bacterium]MCA9430386.1 hypothetical protein [Candidatus Omnitrophota bacterium]MCA9435752.1 hypothetical protein [Candidatus Omnitrophota bacterium]
MANSETLQHMDSDVTAIDHFLALSVRDRLKNAFVEVHRPGLDDGPPMRSWDTTADYREWCEENLEPWLGYCSPEKVQEALEEIEDRKDSD